MEYTVVGAWCVRRGHVVAAVLKGRVHQVDEDPDDGRWVVFTEAGDPTEAETIALQRMARLLHMEQMDGPTVRLSVYLAPDVAAALRAIMIANDTSATMEVCRALSLYAAIERERRRGYNILVQKGDELRTLTLRT